MVRYNKNKRYLKYGKRYCPSHYIKMKDMERIVLEDICSLAQFVVEDEEKAKAKFLDHKAKHHEEQYSVDTKKLTDGRLRLQELTREMCLELIEHITLDAYVEGQSREIYIYYKLIDEPLPDKRSLF